MHQTRSTHDKCQESKLEISHDILRFKGLIAVSSGLI